MTRHIQIASAGCIGMNARLRRRTNGLAIGLSGYLSKHMIGGSAKMPKQNECKGCASCDAALDGKMTPEMAIEFLTQLPVRKPIEIAQLLRVLMQERE